MNSRTGFTVDGQSVDFPLGMSQESEEEWDVNDDPDLDPAYMYARNARGASGYQGFDSASYPHYQYPDETQDNEYYQDNNNHNNSRTNNNDADIIERYGMANGVGDVGNVDEQDGEIKKMPEEYYSSLDVFLSKGPPRILRDRGGRGDKLAANTNVTAKGKQQQPMPSKTTKKGVSAATASGGVPVGVSYSAVKSSGYGPAASGNSKGKKQSSASSSGGRGVGGLDEELLKEAFAYTDKLLREAVLEEQEESQMMMMEKAAAMASKQPSALNNALNNHHRSSNNVNHPHPVPPSKGPSSSSSHHSVAAAYAPAAAPRPPPRSFGSNGGSNGSSGLTLSQLQGMNNVSVVQRLRDEVQGTAAHSSSSSVGGASLGGQGDSGPGSGLFRVSNVGLDQPEVLREGQAKADLASLVSNFESGATLSRLKAELEASQRARDKSR